jgi:zinc transport system substrate-binding protein
MGLNLPLLRGVGGVLTSLLKGVLIGALLTLTAQANSTAPVPHVVVTIKPIHALVSGIMDGVGTPHLLLQGGESPHSYSLRPSQVKQLHAADLLIWVGPAVEIFLEKTITTLSDKTKRLRLLKVQGLTLLKGRKGGAWETHHHDDSHHGAFDVDPHIWLDPDNAKVIVQTIAHALSQIDANNAIHYTANATRLTKCLDQLDQNLTHQLAPVKDLPYLVFHDAYQYFEHRYGLTVVGAISLSPETRPSAKRLRLLRARIKNQQVRCVFSEPQFESALVATLIEDTSVRRGTLDPLGAELAAGTSVYVTLLRNLAKSLKQCLLNQDKAQ